MSTGSRKMSFNDPYSDAPACQLPIDDGREEKIPLVHTDFFEMALTSVIGSAAPCRNRLAHSGRFGH
jgi:hypothetical protein